MAISWIFRSINKRLEPLIVSCWYFDNRDCSALALVFSKLGFSHSRNPSLNFDCIIWYQSPRLGSFLPFRAWIDRSNWSLNSGSSILTAKSSCANHNCVAFDLPLILGHSMTDCIMMHFYTWVAVQCCFWMKSAFPKFLDVTHSSRVVCNCEWSKHHKLQLNLSET